MKQNLHAIADANVNISINFLWFEQVYMQNYACSR